MSKSSVIIWHIRRENVRNLPPPDDMNELHYAPLRSPSLRSLWSTCKFCCVALQVSHSILFQACKHKVRCNSVLWCFRMRCCRNCITTYIPHILGRSMTCPPFVASLYKISCTRIQDSSESEDTAICIRQLFDSTFHPFYSDQNPCRTQTHRSYWVSCTIGSRTRKLSPQDRTAWSGKKNMLKLRGKFQWGNPIHFSDSLTYT